MSCATTGRDVAFITNLNPFGWCPSPAPVGCFNFPLPWEGVQYVKDAGRAEVEAEAAKQAALATKDYTRLFLLLDQYSCVSGFSIRTEEGALKPWEPPAPSLAEYDANPTAFSPPVNSLPSNTTQPAPLPVTVDAPLDPTRCGVPGTRCGVHGGLMPVSPTMTPTAVPVTSPPAVEREMIGGLSLERVALIAGLLVAGITIARFLK